jgi:hypothetical protein
MAKIILPQSALDSVPELYELALRAMSKGAKNEVKGDYVIYNVTNEKLELNIAKFILSKGGIVDKYPLFIRCNADELCPEGLILSEKFDEEGVSLGQKTWAEWKGSNHTFTELSDGSTVIGTNAANNEDLSLGSLAPVFDLLMTGKEVQALQITTQE